MLAEGAKRLGDLQEKLYAEHRWSILVILQGLDAAGKDGVIEHVMSGVNPQGCEVTSFKAPSQLELDHDFLWRARSRCRGAAISASSTAPITRRCWWCACTRSCSTSQNLPPQLITKNIWSERYEDINAFELHLARNGTVRMKFFLNISQEEQKKRLLERIDDPAKQWKFNAGDVGERELWDQLIAPMRR